MDRLVELLKTINLPFAYHHFAEGESPAPPFVVYILPEHHHFSADGRIYHKSLSVQVELYANKKDIALEQQVERVLEERDVYYQKASVWIESEELYETIYIFEMEE